MPLRIEDYAIIGDLHTAALVGNDGSIDWLCLPRFDSPSCFSALLGGREHGHWKVAPEGGIRRVERRYRGDTLVLETTFETEDGAVRLIDFMPQRQRNPDVVRIVEGIRGSVPMRMELLVRFDYGAVIPWVRRIDLGVTFVGGPDALVLHTPLGSRNEGGARVSTFKIDANARVPIVLTWYPSHRPAPRAIDPEQALEDTERFWNGWSSRCTYQGPFRDQVVRSLVTLKALTYRPTGGIVAAPTTSLPELLGGVRNWDYRYCWIRDATFTLRALMLAGYREEARKWRDWLLRAIAGDPKQLQILYGPAGERRIPEHELPWLPGYENSRPVRIGNAAAGQFQLDVFGEVMGCLGQARRVGIDSEAAAWDLQRALLDYLEGAWHRPDDGIWEVRGPRRHFTHSKVMAWFAFDRAIAAVEHFGLEAPVERFRACREEIHREVCERGWDEEKQTFTYFYGARSPDASLLMLPLIGFLPPDDPRIVGTIRCIERELGMGNFVLRYASDDSEKIDGLPPGEGAFLPCSFWYAEALRLMGRTEDAREVFESIVAIANDVGLLSEEYDVERRRLVGNFPQAFTHVGLVNGALRSMPAAKPGHYRS